MRLTPRICQLGFYAQQIGPIAGVLWLYRKPLGIEDIFIARWNRGNSYVSELRLKITPNCNLRHMTMGQFIYVHNAAAKPVGKYLSPIFAHVDAYHEYAKKHRLRDGETALIHDGLPENPDLKSMKYKCGTATTDAQADKWRPVSLYESCVAGMHWAVTRPEFAATNGVPRLPDMPFERDPIWLRDLLYAFVLLHEGGKPMPEGLPIDKRGFGIWCSNNKLRMSH